MFDLPDFNAHEDVHFFYDRESGLRGAVAIHSTRLGPAAGGCRMWNYGSAGEMLTDALRLSQGMSYKNAMAGIDHGGGKAVIWGDSRTQKTPALFRALGRAVNSLQGRYYTAEDVGVSVADMEFAAEETNYVAGLRSGQAASGDPSPVTARGVYMGILETAERAFGTRDLNGRTLAVQGLGSVGSGVARHLAEAGANLILTDIHTPSLETLAKELDAKTVAPNAIYSVEADIFSPNALGAIITPETLAAFKVKAIAGGANNQLATPDMGEALRKSGILYAPDYVINGGGIINVASEITGTYSTDWVQSKLDTLMQTLGRVLDTALAQGASPHAIADEMAIARIESGHPNE